MPHWLQITLSVGGAIASWRFILRPLHRAFAKLMALLERIDLASNGVHQLSLDVHELAGSIVQLVVGLIDRQQAADVDRAEIHSRLNDLAELYTDLSAAVARIRRTLEKQ